MTPTRPIRSFIQLLTQDPLSLAGTAITTASAVLIVTLVGLEVYGESGSPYAGILTYLVLPAIFVLGLFLIPAGLIRHRRREQRARERGESPRVAPVIDLNDARTRNRAVLVFVLTVVNLVILSVATFKGVEVMESREFCGETCHTVMRPEYTAYQLSPHARVQCVECHIGPGAGWFVKSKLSGAWQVVSVAFDLYPRPIPTPIHNLRPARETCEQCHWPTKFVGDRLEILTSYADDEANTELQTVLLLRVGGIEGRRSHGIHWHVDPANVIRYRSDPSRERIYDVELTLADGTVKSWRPDEEPPPDVETEWRTMDCVDCHNRPSHVFRLPHDLVDGAIEQGHIDRDLPYVRRESIRLLRGEYASQEQARQELAEGLARFYRETYPQVAAEQAAAVAAAGRELGTLYASNVFPEMNVQWGSYPNHIGHTDYEGCFRCHNDLHATADGEVISQDCDTCHTLLAMEEESPAIVDELRP